MAHPDDQNKSEQESSRTLSATEARDQFADILRRAIYNDEETVITLHGRPVVAVKKLPTAA